MRYSLVVDEDVKKPRKQTNKSVRTFKCKHSKKKIFFDADILKKKITYCLTTRQSILVTILKYNLKGA